MLRLPLHVPQLKAGYCIPACACMALSRFGVTVSIEEMIRVLEAKENSGALFSLLKRLENKQIAVEIRRLKDFYELQTLLASDNAVIVLMLTVLEMPGWQSDIETMHAILPLEVNDEMVTYHDPFLDHGPMKVMTDAFLLGWFERDNTCAVFTQK